MPVADSDGEPAEVAPDDLDGSRVVVLLLVEVVLRVVLAGQGHVVPLAPVVGLVAGPVGGQACGKKIEIKDCIKMVCFLGKKIRHNDFLLPELVPHEKKVQ